MHRRAGLGVSPASGMITSYDGLITDAPSTSLEVVGSIWKSSEMDRRKNANVSPARDACALGKGGRVGVPPLVALSS